MMKKLTFILLAASCMQSMYSQNTEKNEKLPENKMLFEKPTNVKKKQDKFDLFLNMQGSFDANFHNGFEEGAFKMRQLHTEAKGNLNNWFLYRYRRRLNRSNDSSGNIDNLPTFINITGIGVKLGKEFSIFVGKQCTAYGSIESDLNPIEIYEYNDMIENMSSFMAGLNIGYDINAHQQLNLQILNSRNGSFNKTYNVESAEDELPTIESGKLPLVYTLNWNGNFNDILKTHWSTPIMNEAKGKYLHYYALGNGLNLDKFNMFLDFMYSKENTGRRGIMTGITGSMKEHNTSNVGYFSMITKLNYRFLSKWSVFVKGMYEIASLIKQQENLEKGKYHTAWGYFAGVEFYPMDTNLYFFLAYVGRTYDFTARTKSLGQENHSTNRVPVGFMYQLPMF